MTSREYLNQVKRLHDLMEEEQSDLKDETNLEESELPTNGKEAFQTRLNYLNQLYQKHKEYFPKLQEKVKRKINLLKVEREREVLILRYVDLLDWEKIPKKMDCSDDAVFSVHRRAVKHLEQILKG